MVGHAAGLQGRRFEVVQNPNDVGVQARADFRANQRLAVFGAKDQMNQNFGEGLRHGA
jgi:hypothetical protein